MALPRNKALLNKMIQERQEAHHCEAHHSGGTLELSSLMDGVGADQVRTYTAIMNQFVYGKAKLNLKDTRPRLSCCAGHGERHRAQQPAQARAGRTDHDLAVQRATQARCGCPTNQEDSVWLSHTSKTHKQQNAGILSKTLLEELDVKEKTLSHPAVARPAGADRPCAQAPAAVPRPITTGHVQMQMFGL